MEIQLPTTTYNHTLGDQATRKKHQLKCVIIRKNYSYILPILFLALELHNAYRIFPKPLLLTLSTLHIPND